MSSRKVFALLLAYYAAHVAVRTLISDGIDLDESEQVLWTQDFRLGYGAQPPLYTWIQGVVFRALGTGGFALALVKNALLLLVYVYLFRGARSLLRDDTLAWVATLTVVLSAEFGWNAHSRRTHSILATALGAATLHAAAGLVAESGRRTGAYVRLGLVVGLGILSKYSYLLLAVPLLAAGLSLPRWRRALADRRLLLALGVCLAVAGPHLAWAASNRDFLGVVSQRYFVPGGAVVKRLVALKSLLTSVGGLLVPVSLAYLAVLGRAAWRKRGEPPDESERLLGRTLLGTLVAGLLVALLGGVQMRERWFVSSLFLAPLLLVARYRADLGPARRRILVGLSALVLLGALVAVPLRVTLTGKAGAMSELDAPYLELAERIRAAVPAPARIIADTNLAGAHLRLAFPDTRVIVPYAFPVPERAGPTLVVWDLTERPGPHPLYVKWLRRRHGIALDEATSHAVAAPYGHAPDATASLGYVLVRR